MVPPPHPGMMARPQGSSLPYSYRGTVYYDQEYPRPEEGGGASSDVKPTLVVNYFYRIILRKNLAE